jgi:hypothetical protein
MPKELDMTGHRYGRLLVIARNPEKTNHKSWICICDCGNKKSYLAKNLRCGDSKSCGCYQSDWTRKKHSKHGWTGTPEHRTWLDMRRRCLCKNTKNWHNYGGRKISVCKRWSSFENFLADMGPRPSPRHSLDRINNNGNYEPSNCRWATSKQQLRNTRRNRFLEIDGTTKLLSEWASDYNIASSTLSARRKKGIEGKSLIAPPIDRRRSR